MRYFPLIVVLLQVSLCGASEPLVKIYKTTVVDQERLDGFRKAKGITNPEASEADYVSGMIWTHLAVEIYKKEVKARGIAADQAYVQRKVEANKSAITEEQYEKMKRAEILLHELLGQYRRSGMGVDAFVSDVWKQRAGELRALNIAQDQKLLRSYLLLLDADKGQMMIGSRPGRLPKTRDEFQRQLDTPSSGTLAFFEFTSQIEQLKEAISGKVEASPDEVSKGKAYFEKHKGSFVKREAFQDGGLDALLLEFKKENLVDRWLIEKVNADAVFLDPALKKSYFEWQAKERPGHREVFGPFAEKDPPGNSGKKPKGK